MNFKPIKYFSFLIAALLFFQACSTQKGKVQPPQTKTVVVSPKKLEPIKKENEAVKLILPEVNREFRGVWISSVANINWPSRNNLSADQQKAEAIQLLDLLKNLNFNAVILQVRPASDAIYQSKHEPWSYYLTGELGKSPGYDPLKFWVLECHKRGMELHAWINPFRAHHSTGGQITSSSMVKIMPDQTVRLRNGMYWFDPSDPKTQDHVSNVVKDIIQNYDVDGIHFDDYFYPYSEYNGGRDFPDSKTWNLYKNSGGNLSKEDWRRGNVNKFVKRIYDEIKVLKNTVQFGISPFGIWKPGYPAGVSGTSQYDELFADAKLWLNEGWVDYFVPQLYWKIGGAQDFNELLKWWQSENTKNRNVYPGLNTVGVKNVADKTSEIVDEIKAARSILSKKGEVHWSIAGITNSASMQDALKALYQEKALVPRSAWLKSDPLPQPDLTTVTNGNVLTVKWSSEQPERIFHWILYMKYDKVWEYQILDSSETSKSIELKKMDKSLTGIAIKSVDRLGNESSPSSKIIK